MNAETRSLAVQCQSRKSTGVQTKRLSKEELRYYTKIVDKEKQVLINFMKATKEYPPIRQPHYRVNLFPTQTKFRKSSGTRKKRKHKHSKHSSHKAKHVSGAPRNECEGNEENSGHYVSKIVVDDATRSLKLRVRSCNPAKKGSCELKENKNLAAPRERARSRKAKQPRRFNRSLESLAEEMENNHGGLKKVGNTSLKANMEPLLPFQQPSSVKYNRETASGKEIANPEKIRNDENEILKAVHSPPKHSTVTDKPIIKDEEENNDCLFANAKLRDHFSNPDSSSPPTMTSKFTPVPPGPSDDESSDRQATTSDDDSNYHSQNEDSDDNQSVCSEEFFIVEENADFLGDGKATTNPNVIETRVRTDSDQATMVTEQTDATLKDEPKIRLKANLIHKTVDSEEIDHENKTKMAENKNNITGNEAKALPHVVSVHFYDPQTHSQRVVGADTHITQYPSYTMVENLKSPLTTLPYLKVPPLLTRAPQNSPSATMPSSIPEATLPRSPPINYPYPPYHQNATEIHKQPHAYHIPSFPLMTSKEQTLVQEKYSKDITTRRVPSFDGGTPTQARLDHPGILTNSVASRGVASTTLNDSTEILMSHQHREALTNGITGREPSISNTNVPTDVGIHQPELPTNNSTSRGGSSSHKSSISPKQTEKNFDEMHVQGKKRKRFIFGSHEPPKKKVISSLLTPLCEREATRLADGIHEINMQYFPLRSLAQKAANRVSEDTDDVLKLIDQKIQLKTKIQDVEKARNLLKDIYDMVLKSKEIEDIQNFELVSHNFGVRNILNHLSLVDLYFGELGTELHSKI